MLVRTAHFSLPNVLTGERTVPELLQDQVSAEELVAELEPLWTDPQARAYQMRRFAEVRAQLARNAGARAAETIEALAGRA